VFANGGYLTKHSFGIYSTTPAAGWMRTDPAIDQGGIDAMTSPRFTESPAGEGWIETFTVVHERGLPVSAIVIGRLDDGRRFLSQMVEGLDAFIDRPVIGRRISVVADHPVNRARWI
jgi:acetyl-CoA C-acetyltransferase